MLSFRRSNMKVSVPTLGDMSMNPDCSSCRSSSLLPLFANSLMLDSLYLKTMGIKAA